MDVKASKSLMASEASLKDALKVARAGSMNHVDPEGGQSLIVPVTRNAHVLLGRRSSLTSAEAMRSSNQKLSDSRSQEMSKESVDDAVREAAGLGGSMENTGDPGETAKDGKPIVKPNHEKRRGHDGSTTSGSSTSKEARQRRMNRSQLEGRLSRGVLGANELFYLMFSHRFSLQSKTSSNERSNGYHDHCQVFT